MATTQPDAGSKNWLKERAAISAAHRRQKTDPAVARLIEKADQLHKERTQRHLREPVEETDEKMEAGADALVNAVIDEETDGEDIDAIVNVPPPEEIVVKVAPKPSVKEFTSNSGHGKETSEEVYRSFMETVLQQTLTTDNSLELNFDLKPEDIVKDETDEEEIEEEFQDNSQESQNETEDGEIKSLSDEMEKFEETEDKKHQQAPKLEEEDRDANSTE
ncbi:hypothetical protein G9A89_022467 [Geosiphon pyriformis]|nr:hypothetical protein G9A89_022467 [Geosiphon pyriformis]